MQLGLCVQNIIRKQWECIWKPLMIKIEVWGVGHAIIYYVSQTITVTIQAKSWLAKTNTNTDNFKCITEG